MGHHGSDNCTAHMYPTDPRTRFQLLAGCGQSCLDLHQAMGEYVLRTVGVLHPSSTILKPHKMSFPDSISQIPSGPPALTGDPRIREFCEASTRDGADPERVTRTLRASKHLVRDARRTYPPWAPRPDLRETAYIYATIPSAGVNKCLANELK